MKLVYFVTEDWYFCSHRLQLAMAAKAAGYDVTVITRVREHQDVIREAGLTLVPFEMARSGMNPLSEFFVIVRLARLYQMLKPDIVHHVAMKPVLYGSLAAKIVGVPRVVNALAGMGWLFTATRGFALIVKPVVRGLMRVLLRRGVVLVQNPDDAAMFLSLGLPSGNICRIAGSGVDLSVYIPVPERDGVPVVVLPARLLWDKGVGEFVEAARMLRADGVAARFVLAGEPDEANPASISAEQVDAWVREGCVECRGWIEDMPRLFAEAHVVCLPSYREGLPKALIEASAAGKPIVTTDVPGCREVVRHEDNGFLVPVRDAESLAKALSQLILNPALRKTMGARARERAEAEFGLERIIGQTLALYGEQS